MKRPRWIGNSIFILILSRPVAAQETAAEIAGSFAVGTPAEDFVRYAQSLGWTESSPWSIRPFSRSMFERMQMDSTRSAYIGRAITGRDGPLSWARLPASIDLSYNTSFPYGWNDGAVWRGRGLTMAGSAGVQGDLGSIEIRLAPEAFLAQNSAFPLMPTTASPFADPIASTTIDRPQRFGNRSYGRITGGQSSVAIETHGVAAGVSTGNQWFGPMGEWPLLLGDNAAGFPHLFGQSAYPWNIGVGKVHGRIFYGTLSQSAYTTIPDSAASRYVSGIIGTFTPRFAPNVEIGAARMFQYASPPGGWGWREWRKPFEAFLKEHVVGDPGGSANTSADNQLASVFVRWVVPEKGFETYGEFARDDHSWNARDAILEPEHAAIYGFGLRKAFARPDGLLGFRAEVVNLDPSTLQRERPQGGRYTHTRTRQGHTEDGQVLGAGFAAVNGSGLHLAVERFSPAGQMRSLSFARMTVREEVSSPSTDVQYAIGGEQTVRRGALRIRTGVTVVYEMNRYFTGDVGNVLFTFGTSW
jgi:hypothetical protein